MLPLAWWCRHSGQRHDNPRTETHTALTECKTDWEVKLCAHSAGIFNCIWSCCYDNEDDGNDDREGEMMIIAVLMVMPLMPMMLRCRCSCCFVSGLTLGSPESDLRVLRLQPLLVAMKTASATVGRMLAWDRYRVKFGQVQTVTSTAVNADA